jgi:hypothetical protein
MRTADANIADRAGRPAVTHISERALKRFAIVIGLMLTAYLVGFVPGWLSANELEARLARSKELNGAHALKADLAAASLHSSQGRFEEAIVAAGSFFDKLDKEIVAGGGILNNEPALGEAAANMLARRDEIVTMLARGDPAASGVLVGWYFELEQVTNGEK